MQEPVSGRLAEPWKHYLVGYGLLRRDGRVLLVQNRWRWDVGLPLVWTLPGGRAEEGESIIAAMRREFREETGLTPEAGPLLWVAEYFDVHKRQHFVSFAFLVVAAVGEVSFEGDENVVDTRFVEEDALAEYLYLPSFQKPLLEYLHSPAETPRYYLFESRNKE